MKIVVISLGGSLIIPDKINFKFLDAFKKEIRKHYRTHKFVVVCGGGLIARRYIAALRAERKSIEEMSEAGIMATRMNALFMIQFFGKEANKSLPVNMEEIKDSLAKNNVVFCGALRYSKDSTSDGTAAKIAHFLKADFINLTNVKGLYTDDPKVNKNAKFVPYETWEKFEKMALKIKYNPGQHFILDQQAAIIIREYRIKTYIIGSQLKNLSNIIKGKKFIGTEIDGIENSGNKNTISSEFSKGQFLKRRDLMNRRVHKNDKHKRY
ncbi:MAG: UMP kinase [Nanoarchaeota archaeon]|nr:UMP kinase [Nanoarchaeota archaeon]